MERTKTILTYWKRISLIPVLVLDKEGKIYYYSKSMSFINTEPIMNFVKNVMAKNHMSPCIEIVDHSFAYSLFYDQQEMCYILGPIAIGEYSNADLSSFSCSPISWFSTSDRLAKISLSQLEAESKLLICCITGDIQTNIESSLSSLEYSEYEIQQHQFQRIDNEETRNSYEEILPLLDAVRCGDKEEFFRIYDSSLLERTGKLAKSPFKQSEYLTVKIISLVMHAMIDGGVDYQIAYNTSDIYLQKLECCENIAQMRKLQLNYAVLAINLVHKLVKTDYSITEEVKLYISRHKNMRFSIGSMAKDLNVNASYLSRAFAQKEGMTIQQYINQERIKSACNMLIYSNSTITEIAFYLCFSSQSHFSHQFKAIMGMTPSQYRKNKQSQQKFKTSIHG